MRRSLVLLGSLLTACTAPDTQPLPDVARVGADLDSALRHHAERFIAKDLNGVVASYTADPVVFSNHMLPLRGRDELAPALTALFQTGDIKSLSYTTEELAVSGDSAWQILRFRITVQPAGTSSIVADSGGAFALWIRDSTGWKIHRDILNSSVPLPVPPRP